VGAVGLLLALAALDRFAPLTPRPAQALENPADDRQSMLSELHGINEKLDRLIGLLDGGKVKVIVGNAEEVRGAAPPGSRADGERARGGEPGGQPAAQPIGPPAGSEEPKIIIRQYLKADHAGK
jgi:hypothetical protein